MLIGPVDLRILPLPSVAGYCSALSHRSCTRLANPSARSVVPWYCLCGNRTDVNFSNTPPRGVEDNVRGRERVAGSRRAAGRTSPQGPEPCAPSGLALDLERPDLLSRAVPARARRGGARGGGSRARACASPSVARDRARARGAQIMHCYIRKTHKYTPPSPHVTQGVMATYNRTSNCMHAFARSRGDIR